MSARVVDNTRYCLKSFGYTVSRIGAVEVVTVGFRKIRLMSVREGKLFSGHVGAVRPPISPVRAPYRGPAPGPAGRTVLFETESVTVLASVPCQVSNAIVLLGIGLLRELLSSKAPIRGPRRLRIVRTRARKRPRPVGRRRIPERFLRSLKRGIF